MNTPRLESNTRNLLVALVLMTATLSRPSIGLAQNSPETNVQVAPGAATENPPGTNAPAGGGRRGRGNVNTLVFPPEETNRLKQLGNRDVGLHDPSTIVKCKDEYWIFWTGNRGAPGVPSYRSKDLVNWERGPSAITNAPPWTTNVPNFRGNSFWAPDIIHLDNRYLLYFSASSFGRNTSGIGLLTNPTLDPNDPNFQWSDQGVVVQSWATNNFNTIDPAVTVDADGKLWMAFGSFWSGIKLIELDPKTGLRIAPDSPMYSLAHYSSIEASYIYRHGGHYYLFVNWGRCCQGANSTYEIRVGRSERITGPYLDKERKDLLSGGGTLVLKTDGAFIGPGHACILEERGQYWFGCHFYDGTTQRGTSKYAIRPMVWAADGWPEIGPALPK